MIWNIEFSPVLNELNNVDDSHNKVRIPIMPAMELLCRISITSINVDLRNSVVESVGGKIFSKEMIRNDVTEPTPKIIFIRYIAINKSGIKYSKILNAIPADIKYR